MEQVTRDEITLFIQNNENFYKRKFKKMDDTGKSVSWNWAAFFMGIYWMVYRKMYFKAGAFLLLSMVASYTPYIGSILNLCVLFGIAVYANALYKDHVENSIKKVSILFPEKKEEALEKIGGTNLPMTIGIGVAHFIIVFIVLVMGL